jgi:hypothetical protein
MKILFYFIICSSFIFKLNIGEIRKLYPAASSSESNATVLASKLAGISLPNKNKTLVAYKGASIVILAKFKKKVKDKVAQLKEGAKLIELAIASEPNNIEIRMIRLSIQENVPSMVNYRKNKKEDKMFLLSHYKDSVGALSTYIKNFILQSKSFSSEEKGNIK